MRLQKYLSGCGIASRRKAEEMITAGRVSVNGHTVTTLGTKIQPDADKIALDGTIVATASGNSLIYVILHKPEGVITSVSDPQNRPVVMDYVKDIQTRIFPVGRLDFDSSGLLLLTNDGELTNKLTHPSYSVPKTYIARLKKVPDKGSIKAFKEGLILEDGYKTAPADIKIIKKSVDSSTVRIIIHEGRNRQIRKMCKAIGCPVTSLKRVSMGPLKLGNLARGAYRHLTQHEVSSVRQTCQPDLSARFI